VAKKTTATKGGAKAAPKGKKKKPAVVMVVNPGPPPTDIRIGGIDLGYITSGVSGSTVVSFSSHFKISGTVTPTPMPPAVVHGYVYSMGQRCNAADTMTDPVDGSWTLEFDLSGLAVGSDAQIKVIVDVPGDPASQIMGLTLFAFFDTGLFDELIDRDGYEARPAR
jgi:hypothetical protein